MDPNSHVFFVIFGAALALGGWVVFWFSTRLLGLTAGLGFGFAFGQLLATVIQVQGPTATLVLLACSLLGAVGGFFFMRAVTAFFFALVGFLFGALLGRVGLQAYLLATTGEYVLTSIGIGVILGTGVVFAILGVVLQRSITILVTSFAGATFLVAGLPIRADREIWYFVGMFAASVIWQTILVTYLLVDRPKPPRAEKPAQ
jgi:hypothetical protein